MHRLDRQKPCIDFALDPHVNLPMQDTLLFQETHKMQFELVPHQDMLSYSYLLDFVMNQHYVEDIFRATSLIADPQTVQTTRRYKADRPKPCSLLPHGHPGTSTYHVM